MEIEQEITEVNIRTIKSRLNRGIKVDLNSILPHNITTEQTYKGLAWLIKQASLRDSPFGNREQNIIANFEKFELLDFVDTAGPEQLKLNIHWYQPVYRVFSKNKSHFDYYYDWQKIHICG